MNRLLFLLALSLGASGIASAQTRTVSMPDTSGVPGTMLSIPVRVAGFSPGDGVTSAEFTFAYPTTAFDWVGVSTAGTLLDGRGTVEASSITRRVAVALQDTLSGSGTLFHLNLRVRQNATKYALQPVSFASARVNEGTPDVTVDDGSVRILGISLLPGNVSNLLLTDTLAFGLTGDGQAPYTWSVSNTDIATIDADGVLRPQALGFVRVFVRDALGLQDSTNFFRIQPAALAQLGVALPDTTTRQTRELRLPLRTTDLTGIGATSFETTVAFAPSALVFLGVDTEGSLMDAGPAPTVQPTADRIRIAYAADTPLEGVGTLLTLRFRVSPTYLGQTTVGLENTRFNEDLIPRLDAATVNILAAPPIGISPNPVSLTPGRSVALQVTGDGKAPFTFQIEGAGVASEADGVLTGLMRGLTRVRAVDSEGFPSPWVPVQVFDIEARLADTTVVYPDTMRLPLMVESLTGLGIRSAEAIVRYDTTLFTWLGVETTSISAAATIQTERIGRDIRIAMAGTEDLIGAGDLLLLSFIPQDGIGNLIRMPLSLVRLRFNESSDSTATAHLFDGGLTNNWNWTVPSLPRNLTALPEPGSVVGVRLTWSAPESDGGRPVLGYLIQFKQATASEWTTFNGGDSPDTTLVVDGLLPATAYDFRIAARNEIGLGDFLSGVTATGLDRHDDTPLQTALLGNYPNPFNPSTVIGFQLSVSGNVRLTVYDILGRQVALLAEGHYTAGMHQVRFLATNLSSGMYLYRLETEGSVFVRTLLLLK